MHKAYSRAVALLARREHGAQELAQKLRLKGYAAADVMAALAECQRLDLQSDARFVENIVRARIRQGYGPERIRQELKSKQIEGQLIATVLAAEQEHWLECALQVWQKKYKQIGGYTYSEIQKQKQFLLYRGFTVDTINLVFEYITNE